LPTAFTSKTSWYEIHQANNNNKSTQQSFNESTAGEASAQQNGRYASQALLITKSFAENIWIATTKVQISQLELWNNKENILMNKQLTKI